MTGSQPWLGALVDWLDAGVGVGPGVPMPNGPTAMKVAPTSKQSLVRQVITVTLEPLVSAGTDVMGKASATPDLSLPIRSQPGPGRGQSTRTAPRRSPYGPSCRSCAVRPGLVGMEW